MNQLEIKILHIDSNHPLLWEQLEQAGFQNEADFTSSKAEIEEKIRAASGLDFSMAPGDQEAVLDD